MSHATNILVVDDHRVFAEGLVAVLKIVMPNNAFQVAFSAEDAIDILEKHADFHLVITDISMTGRSGLELVRHIKQYWAGIKVLMLSMHNERQIVSAVLDAEAEGFVLKTSTAQEIATAANEILNGKTHYSREVLNVLLQKERALRQQQEVKNVLSDREIEVLKLIMEELSSDQIAEKLFISRRTVDTHRANIQEKTSCKNLIALFKYAARNGLIEVKDH